MYLGVDAVESQGSLAAFDYSPTNPVQRVCWQLMDQSYDASVVYPSLNSATRQAMGVLNFYYVSKGAGYLATAYMNVQRAGTAVTTTALVAQITEPIGPLLDAWIKKSICAPYKLNVSTGPNPEFLLYFPNPGYNTAGFLKYDPSSSGGHVFTFASVAEVQADITHATAFSLINANWEGYKTSTCSSKGSFGGGLAPTTHSRAMC